MQLYWLPRCQGGIRLEVQGPDARLGAIPTLRTQPGRVYDVVSKYSRLGS
jgi:hypothetical protein